LRLGGVGDTLHKGRQLCQNDDRAFGDWLKTNRLDHIGADNREALINMGRHRDVTEQVLAATKKTSLRTLWLLEIKPKIAPPPTYRRPAVDAGHKAASPETVTPSSTAGPGFRSEAQPLKKSGFEHPFQARQSRLGMAS
jgi:hypothetical protein